MGLAEHSHVAAKVGVTPRQRAGAPIEPVADLDHDVGVGAEHHEIAPAQLLEPRIIIFWRLVVLVDQSGADDVIGVARADQPNRRAKLASSGLEQTNIAFRPEVMAGRAVTRDDLAKGQFARRDQIVIATAGKPEMFELAPHLLAGARGVGDQHRRPAAGAIGPQRIRRGREVLGAVDQHAPNVAEYGVIPSGERRQARHRRNIFRAGLPPHRGCRAQNLAPSITAA